MWHQEMLGKTTSKNAYTFKLVSDCIVKGRNAKASLLSQATSNHKGLCLFYGVPRLAYLAAMGFLTCSLGFTLLFTNSDCA
jgi:hypothetical protein